MNWKVKANSVAERVTVWITLPVFRNTTEAPVSSLLSVKVAGDRRTICVVEATQVAPLTRSVQGSEQ